MLTENPGLALGVLSGLTLVWALWRRSTWGCALAGVVIGLCSLSSGELILAVPINAILMASLGLFGVIPFQRCVRLTLAFTVGTSLMLLPWMALQKARFGIFTLTMNTPELLAGGSDPVHGKLDRAMHAEANALGLDVSTAANLTRRYHYFSERFASQVKADPLGYIWRVLNASRESLADIRSNDPLIRLLIPLSVLGAGVLGVFRWRAPQPLLLSGALVLFLANEDDPWPAHWLTVLIAALATCRWKGRRLLALGAVASTLMACMLLCGLSGNVASRRFWNVADWAIVLLWVVGAAMTLRLIFAGVAKVPGLGWGMVHPPQAASLAQPGGRLRECMPIAVIVSMVSLIALGIVLVRHQIGPRPVYSPASVATSKTTASAGNDEMQLVRFDDFTITLGRWEHAAHWRPYYYTARESRWLARPRLIQADGTLGSRVIVEAPLSQLSPPPAWEPMICIGKTTMMTDPISGAAVGVLRVTRLLPAKLEAAR